MPVCLLPPDIEDIMNIASPERLKEYKKHRQTECESKRSSTQTLKHTHSFPNNFIHLLSPQSPNFISFKMHAFKTSSFTFLLLAANVQAGRITYTCYNKPGGLKKEGVLEQKGGGSIPDDQEKFISNVEKVANKKVTTMANNEQIKLVNSHIKKTKRDNDDDLIVDDDVYDGVNDDINDDLSDIDNTSDDYVPECAF
ncbi:hypothetical protein DSL72_008379 [Monilinia vaccinii-corymbosi]|uniref:Uncharacterized protein n=1 Tax=Monilinia vaccinii-corymbosi TaxID=61207 RepID=A0A8A3PKK0_9HELO|nr:hypothetical protein DSL72_008379 [Monilinia vaccinii-corymbosi]